MSDSAHHWYQLIVACTDQNALAISDALFECNASSVTFLDGDDQPLLEPGPDEICLWQHVQLQALFESVAARSQALTVLATFGIDDYQLSLLEEENWHLQNQAYEPLIFSDRLCVCADLESATIFPNHAILLLPPGLGFGTGTHATTALCLDWLAEHIKGGETLIDFGCGSGILALAALKLGAQKAWAFDHDPQALTATTHNAMQNNLDNIVIQASNRENPLPMTALLIANILTKPLIELVAYFASAIQTGGTIVLSGILAEESAAIDAAYTPYFHCQGTKIRDGWLCWVGLKR